MKRNNVIVVKTKNPDKLFKKANKVCEQIYQKKNILEKGYSFKDAPDIYFVCLLNKSIVGTLGLKAKHNLNETLPIEQISDIKANYPASELMRFSLSCPLKWHKQIALILFETALDFLVTTKLIHHPIFLITHNGVIDLFQKATNMKIFVAIDGNIFLSKIPFPYKKFYSNKKIKIFQINREKVLSYYQERKKIITITP